MPGQFTYQDFDLLIEPVAAGGYRARVLRSPAGESAPVQFSLPFSSTELENFVFKIGLARHRTRGPGRPESAPLKDFGGTLYGAVFQDELHDTLQRCLSQTRAQGVGLRLRLRLADAPELAELPWEFLYDPRHDRFLAQSRHSPLVRYLELPDPPQPLSINGPLRLLVMISNPSDYPALNVEQEWNVLSGALAKQIAEGRVTVTRIAANMSTLRALLRREEFHVFHFVGHGFYRPDWNDGLLVMEDSNGRPHEVTGDVLGSLLSEYSATRLAVLNACEGAHGGIGDPFAGMAQSLIQQGLPAVVAMQFEITDDAAIIFARELYGAIADGFPLEAALAEARGAIRDVGNLTEWGTPVLYSRASDGHLFDLTGLPGSLKAESHAAEEANGDARDNSVRKAEEQTARQRDEQHLKVPGTQSWSQVRQPRILQVEEDLYSMAVSSGGTRLATGHGSQARVWNLQTGAAVRKVRAGRDKTYKVLGLAFSPDGTRLATGSRDKTARIWHTATGRQHFEVTHNGVVCAVAFSPDGAWLATGGGNMVRTWDTTTGQQGLEFTHGEPVLAVAFSRDGTRLAISGSNMAQIWDASTGQQQFQVAFGDTMQAVAFSPDGTRLATGAGKIARIWDISGGHGAASAW